MSNLVGGMNAASIQDAMPPTILEQICSRFDSQLGRLHHAVHRTVDNTDRLVGIEPPSPEPATNVKEKNLILVVDRIQQMLEVMDRLTDKLHQTNDRLSRL